MANTENQNWTTVIRPKTGWFDIDLRELWKYRDLVGMFVKRNFTVLYKIQMQLCRSDHSMIARMSDCFTMRYLSSSISISVPEYLE